MSSDRATIGGVGVLRYRVTRVTELSDGVVSLNTDIRHYAVGPKALPASAQPGLSIGQFESQGTVEVTRKVGEFLPSAGQLKLPFAMAIMKEGQPGPAGMSQGLTVLRVLPVSSPSAKP